MSWSAYTGTVRAHGAVHDLRENYRFGAATRAPEVNEQFEAAVRAIEIALPVVQPDLDGAVSITASGHANPEHKPAAGWANDCFTLTITQMTVPASQ